VSVAVDRLSLHINLLITIISSKKISCTYIKVCNLKGKTNFSFFLSFRKESGGSSTEMGKQKESDRRDDLPSGLNR